MSPWRASRTIAALVVAVGGTAACSLLVSVDGLAGGGGSGDGGSGDEAATTFDAGGIGDADGGKSPPASCDVGPCVAPEASTSGFCASRTPADFLCADFDGNDFLAAWTGQFASADGSVGTDDGGSTSAPFSLLATAARDGGTLPTAGVVKTFTQTVNGFHLELDIEPLGDTIFQYVEVLLSGYSLILGTGLTGARFIQEDATFGDGGTARKIHFFTGASTTGPWTTGVWHHVVVDAVLTAPATVDVQLDGASALAAEPLLYSAVAGSQGTLRVGQLFIEPGMYTTRFDNVVFDPK